MGAQLAGYGLFRRGREGGLKWRGGTNSVVAVSLKRRARSEERRGLCLPFLGGSVLHPFMVAKLPAFMILVRARKQLRCVLQNPNLNL